MVVFRRGLALLTGASLLAVFASFAHADTSACRVISLDFTPGGIPAGMRTPPGQAPSGKLYPSAEILPQIVAWIETPAGDYVDTVYITQQTGRYGIGNRPGRYDFNSGPRWPYGRRITVFPVWANKQPRTFPQVDYNNDQDDNLSHPFNQSSSEGHFCRPLEFTDVNWDGVTCSSTVYTDKGVFGSQVSHYPPRADVTAASVDSPSVAMYKALNAYDAVSQATPALGAETQIGWPIPDTMPAGDYVMVMEVALEQDFNATYSAAAYPSPSGILYGNYGVPYRGQPSVIYQVPFTLAAADDTTAMTDHYVGYGDPTGADGTIRAPDGTISETTPNSGASRLLLTSRDGAMFRLRVATHAERDTTAPAEPGDMLVVDATSRDITLSFAAPGDDGMFGTVQGYEVRYAAGDAAVTADNFASMSDARFSASLAPAGQTQEVTVQDLLPETTYTVAVRAYDNCHNVSAIRTTRVTTAARASGSVDACFVATAAYGSVLANDVEMLRRFRDSLLKRSVLGELAVETYYTFGPPVAGVVGESDLLRSTARDVLDPLVRRIRSLRW